MDQFKATESRERCLRFRKRILDISQKVSALHIASAYSCMEIVELIYFGLMRRDGSGNRLDTFLMSKGHGCMAQYVALEELGILSSTELDAYCTPDGILGTHPDYGNPGIEASTGSLGHGLSLAVGLAYADKVQKKNRTVYAVLSDGEMQEGSTWESILLAPTFKVDNLVCFLDLNDFQSFGRTSELFPAFYPVVEKLLAFGWHALEVDGHDSAALHRAVQTRPADRPAFIVAKTVKGKGVSFMEHVPIWHYRAPNPEEYQRALADLEGRK